MTEPEPPEDLSQGWLVICVVAAGAGVLIGFVGGAFRWCLNQADVVRGELSDWAHRVPGPGWLVLIAVAVLGATLAAVIVRWLPLAAGSGIQHVEAVYRGDAEPALLPLLPAKFVGGVLAIGSGLVLGREGPTVHMGAAIGAAAARRARLTASDVAMLQSALGGAGLAVAFNAPIAGVFFTLEEVTKSFRPRTVLATILATSTAVGCSQLVTGFHPDFDVESLSTLSVGWLPLFIVFGLLTGCIGALYNRLVLGFLDRVKAVPRIPTIAKASAIGALIGVVTYAQPLATGGGDPLTQSLLSGNGMALSAIVGLLLLRMVTGPLSYAAAVPGGLFAPLLALGSLWGVLFAGGFDAVWPVDHTSLAVPMAIVGMAAFFGASIRAPVTGILIVIEMTATTEVAVPMLAATAAAVVVAEFLRSPPIYDSLRARMPAPRTKPDTQPQTEE